MRSNILGRGAFSTYKSDKYKLWTEKIQFRVNCQLNFDLHFLHLHSVLVPSGSGKQKKFLF